MISRFTPPQDITAWWCAPHCDVGCTDSEQTCPFCERTRKDCADEFTGWLSAATDRMVHALVTGGWDDGYLLREEPCACSGFWCVCGRFWANDDCGNLDPQSHRASDNVRMMELEGRLYCPCGRALFYARKESQDG